MNKYEINIFWSSEDECFVAEVPDLPGCMAHGESHETALEKAKEAIDLWIDTAKQAGRTVPKPRDRSVTITY